jgi:hypothetical protein
MPRISEMNEKIEGAFAFSYRRKIGKLSFTNAAEGVCGTDSESLGDKHRIGDCYVMGGFSPGN